MAQRCDVCGKGPKAGRTIARRGLAKKVGGVGKRITGVSRRRFLPNLHHVRCVVNGATSRLLVCTSCLSKGKVTKAPRRAYTSTPTVVS